MADIFSCGNFFSIYFDKKFLNNNCSFYEIAIEQNNINREKGNHNTDLVTQTCKLLQTSVICNSHKIHNTE